MTQGQYFPLRLEQARLVRSLLYGDRAIEFAGFRKQKKYTAYDRFHVWQNHD